MHKKAASFIITQFYDARCMLTAPAYPPHQQQQPEAFKSAQASNSLRGSPRLLLKHE